MNLIIYIDVLFLLNMLIDYIILSSTALIAGVKVIKWRLLLAASAGALYSVVIFFPHLNLLNIVIFKILMSAVIILISFKYISLFIYFKEFISYYIINAIYGGGMYAFYHFTALGSKMNFSNGVYYVDLPLWLVIALAFIFYFIVKLFTKIFDSRTVQKNIREIKIYFEKTQITVSALFDTGNTLYDPISLLPVMLVESSLFKGKLSTGFLECISDDNANSLPLIHKLYPELKLRIIPFQDVTGKKNIIYAFKPQKIVESETGREITNMLIGITPAKLSPDSSYNALLHSNI